MKKHYRAMLALVLVLTLCVGTVFPSYAAGKGNGNGNNKNNASVVNTNNGKHNGKDKGNTSKGNNKHRTVNTIPELTLVEDETTVANGSLLRAATYAIDEPVALADEGTVAKFFPVTMFDYDQNVYNNVLKEQEFTETLDEWHGIYMGNGNGSHTYMGNIIYGGPENGNVYYRKVEDPVNHIVDGGQYVLVSACEGSAGSDANGVYVGVGIDENNNVISVMNKQNGEYANPITDIAVWTVTKNNEKYRFQSGGRYLQLNNRVATSDNQQNITVRAYTGSTTGDSSDYANTIVLNDSGNCMNKNKGFNHVVGALDSFALYGGTAETGNAFYLYEVVKGASPLIETELKKSLEFANYNKWTAYIKENENGNKVYQGLARNRLDANNNIQFNYPDAGLFTLEEFAGKRVYTNVGMPFEYNSTTQEYSFNAKEMGAWFEREAASDTNLSYSVDPQARIGDQLDTSVAGWFPFDDSTDVLTVECKGTIPESETVMAKPVGNNPNYYFGMSTSINFTMTPDGKLKNGEDIHFHFSGDDDVWVFVDGTLVLDIGGIHNRIDGDINFAEGIWSIRQTWKSSDLAEDVNNGTANTSGGLWEKLGYPNQAAFAAKENHTLSVFYLERGAGASNCEITFNLPLLDYVSVTKNATKDNQDTDLTEAEKKAVNNMDFTYEIYRNGESYANQVYVLYDATTNTPLGKTGSTDEFGRFTIKNNQKAQFTTSFRSKGSEAWYVEEVNLDTKVFDDEKVTWNATASTIDNPEMSFPEVHGLISGMVEVKGSDEASGRIDFVCENFVKSDIPNPGIATVVDNIVIDYGLPVDINVKANDFFRGDEYEIVGINGSISEDKKHFTDGSNIDGSYTTSFGKVKITNAKEGILEYQLTEQLTDVEKIDYIVKITDWAENGVGTEINDYVYAIGTVYVIPATSMYYEENFKTADGISDMIVYGSGWNPVGKPETEHQESGVVGALGNSPYGSDRAYLKDSGDSNGSSRYASTKDGVRSFEYEFTGTGTSFFARTAKDTGYMRVVLRDKTTNEQKNYQLINTRFLADAIGERTLYNIPVYTLDNLEYGTYIVTVTIAKNNANTSFGTDFWLDGIRVQNPLKPDKESENYKIAQSAYAADGEANVNIVTLREKLLDVSGTGENWGEGFAVLTDINGNITSASDYKSIGPKQEVYLAGSDVIEAANGQTVSFTLEQWDTTYNLYIGIKAPMGTAKLEIGGRTVTISNTADCYYEIVEDDMIPDGKGNYTIKLQAVEGIVSITNIKTAGKLKFDIL